MRWKFPQALRPRHLTLDFYMGRRFSFLIVADLFIFALVYVLIDSLGQLDAFLEHATDFLSLLGIGFTYYLHELPGLFCRFLGPVVTMASAMFAVTLTARANEIVPVLATGTSVRRLLAPLLVLAVLIAGFSFAVQEVWIPGHRDEIRHALSYGRDHGTIDDAHYTNRREGLIVAARTYDTRRQRAEGVWIFIQKPGREFLYTAAAAQWKQPEDGPGHWELEEGEVQEYGPDGLLVPQPVKEEESATVNAPLVPGNISSRPVKEESHEPAGGGPGKAKKKERRQRRAPTTALTRPFDTLRVDFTRMIPQDLEGSESQDLFLGVRDLRRRAEVAPDLHRHRWRIKYYARFVDPLHHIILILLGVPALLMRGTRNVFLSALVAVAIATGYFVAQAIFIYLGNRRLLDPATAVWLGPILFGGLGLTLWTSLRS